VAIGAWYPKDDAGRDRLADELTGNGFRPTQSKHSFDRDKIERMADAMLDGTFDWNAASLQPVILGMKGEILGGHHRVVAAHLVGIDLMAVPGTRPQFHTVPPEFPMVRAVSDWKDVLPDV
jgi:hypothetical protein